jgi:GTP 3',8-cyclase
MTNDSYGRTIDYLRISVTDRCNERCTYCMPKGYHGWAEKTDHLSAQDILRIARAACSLGFRKFRLTGGEPLIRPDIVTITEQLWNLNGVESLGISTNGTQLKKLAQPTAPSRTTQSQHQPRRPRPSNLPPRQRWQRARCH